MARKTNLAILFFSLWWGLCCGFLIVRFWNRPQTPAVAEFVESRDAYERTTDQVVVVLIIVGSTATTLSLGNAKTVKVTG